MGSPIFIAAAPAGEFQKYAVVSFPWTKTAFTPLFTGILPHVMMMVEIKILRKMIAKQTCAIVDGLKTELDKCNIGGHHDVENHGGLGVVLSHSSPRL